MNKTVEIRVIWKRSAQWGMNPHLEGWTPDESDSYRKHITCGGCGYDKLAAVVADFINGSPAFLSKLQEMTAHPNGTMPYGYRAGDDGQVYCPGGGAGIDSIKRGLEYIGLHVMHCSGEIYDHFEISGDFEPRKKVAFCEVVYKNDNDATTYTIPADWWGNDNWNKNYHRVIRRFTRKVKPVIPPQPKKRRKR